MKMYGKMLKKLFGAATVCVAFGAANLKATFEQDLRNVCKKCKVDPAGVSIFLESYKSLYQEFKGKVVVKMRKLHNLRLKEKKIVDDGSIFCPGKSEIEMLQFAKWLWKQVESVRGTAQQSTCGHGVLDKECYDAFMGRICNFGFACIRFSAGRFASEKMLFDEKDIESKEKIIYILESIPAAIRHCIMENVFRNEIHFPRLLMICDRKKYEEPDWEEYIQGIYKRCCSISDYAKDCRLCLTKLSDQDFDEINVLFESVKDVDRLWEIDKLKEEKERVSHELDGKKIELEKLKKRQKRLSEIAIDIKYDESGEIVSAMPKEKKYEYEADISRLLYNDHRFVLVEVEKLRNRKTSLEAEITEYEAKTHIKDRKLTKGIFAFRKYNACLRFFFFTSTLLINMP